MEFGNPYVLIVFFGIFHVTGGLALGKGLRETLNKTEAGKPLMAWGFLMGAVPMLFDWFFLIRIGESAGWVGPALFVTAIICGWLFFTHELSRKNEKSIAAVLMGGTALMLGLMLTPYLLQQVQIRENLGWADYLCGGSIPLFFILIGGSFAWSGFQALQKKRSFDDHIAEREADIKEKSENKRGKS